MKETLIKPFLGGIKGFILDTLFPKTCLACGSDGEFICADCKAVLIKLDGQRCIACQKPTPFGFTHAGCLTPHSADGLISFYDYHDEKVAKIIIGGKYSFIPSIYKILGKMIAEKITADYPYLLSANSCELAYVPLHASRQRWRGFNQAQVLCQTLSEELDLPIVDVLQRAKVTQTQKDLKKEQRLKNVDSAFKLQKSADVHGKNLILVDDVTTTGATLQEAAKILKRNGAAQVICLTIARD